MTTTHLQTRAKTAATVRPATPARRRVLVAEDHDDTRLLLRLLLEKRGFDVLEAVNGEDAIRLSENARPDLILIDGSLPRLDGCAVTRHLRAQQSTSSVPIIFLSGHAEPRARSAAFAVGCDAYLIKPDGLESLTAVLSEYLPRD